MSKVRKTRVINRIDSNNSKLCRFGYVDYIVLASTLAIAISEEVNMKDLDILATFFAVLSDELALISSIKSCDEESQESIFAAPIPDTVLTRSKPTTKKNKKRKKLKRRFKALKIQNILGAYFYFLKTMVLLCLFSMD